jgi:uncharacterized protein YlzI (FlbEa/FlbD family)
MIEFIVLQTLDGRHVHINPAAIVSIHEARGRLVTDKVHCVVSLVNGKFVTVVESCDELRRLKPKDTQP